MAGVKGQPSRPVYLAVLLGWLLPGMGHVYLGGRLRGAIIAVAVLGCFLLGELIGGLRTVDPGGNVYWFFGQVLAGLPAIVAAYLHGLAEATLAVGNAIDLARLYTGVAGLLNLLAVVDLVAGPRWLEGGAAR